MCTAPVRAEPGFGSTVTRTVPLPSPDAPLAICSHGACGVAVQAQPVSVVTLKFTFPPSGDTDGLLGETA